MLTRSSVLRVSLLSFLLATTLHAHPRYTLEDLGPAFGNALNSRGVAAGSVFPADGPQQAARLQAGSPPLPLGFLVPDGWISIGFGINDAGVIVGLSGTDTVGITPARAFRWTAATGMQPFPSLLGAARQHEATSINTVGTSVGFAVVDITVDMRVTQVQRPVVWIGTQASDLGTGSAAEGAAQFVSEAGDIVGLITTPTHQLRAVLWPLEGSIVDLGAPPNTFSFANALTMDRRIVGQVGLQAFLWTPTTGMQLLPLLPGDTSSGARGINEAGLIVGTGDAPAPFPGTSHALVWQPDGTPADLNLLVDAPAWDLQLATAINASGQILVVGDLDGNQRTALLTPIVPRSPVVTVPPPEPAPPPTTPPPSPPPTVPPPPPAPAPPVTHPPVVTPPPPAPTPAPAPPVVAQPVPVSPPPPTPPQPPSQEPPPVASQPPAQSPPTTTTPVMASTSGGSSGGGCTLAPGAGGDPMLVSLCGIMMLHLAWKRGRRAILLKSGNLVQG
jgi:hypothetical protein